MQGQPDHTPWYQPRTAEIIQRGGENTAAAIGAGLQQFAQGIASGVMRRQEQKRLAEEKEAETAKTFRTYVAMGEQLGLPANALKNAGAEGAKGMVEGYIAKQKFDEFAAQIQERRAKAAAEARDAGALSRFQRSHANMTTPLQIPAGTFGPLSRAETIGGPIGGEDRFNLMQKAGVSPEDQYKLMRAYGEQGGGENVMPVPATIAGRNLIVNPKSGAFQDVTPQSSAAIPKDFVALGATMDENGKLDIRYGPPKAEGKALSQTEVAGIAALNQAEMDLNTLENTYKELGENYGGPVSARVKSVAMGGQNPNIAALENAITAATPNLARGVFREVGVLTDQDVARYKQLLPAPTDTQEVRTRKIKQLRDRIAQGRKEMVTSLEAAGRDVQGFSKGAGGDVPRFDSEDAARAANVGTNVFEMYDPATATYRKARLK